MATPLTAFPPTSASDAAARVSVRRLRLDEILTLMMADGLIGAYDAETLLRSPTRRLEHPLEVIAERNWHTANPPRRTLTLEFLVEWLAGKLGVPYLHIDPLKIDLTAVTQSMT